MKSVWFKVYQIIFLISWLYIFSAIAIKLANGDDGVHIGFIIAGIYTGLLLCQLQKELWDKGNFWKL